jgi:hypothetical protein
MQYAFIGSHSLLNFIRKLFGFYFVVVYDEDDVADEKQPSKRKLAKSSMFIYMICMSRCKKKGCL